MKTILIGLIIFFTCVTVTISFSYVLCKEEINYTDFQESLPNTQSLTYEGDLFVKMKDGAHQFIQKKIDESVSKRPALWNRDFSSPRSYELSVDPNSKRFMQYIWVEDKNEPYINYRVGLEDGYPPVYMEKLSINDDPEVIAETSGYRIYQVLWPVLNRVFGGGLLLQPKSNSVTNVVAIPDADQTPEQLAGLSPGIPEGSQFARRLAENGFQVLIPVLVNRTFINEGKPEQMTYRERLYRQAFHMGRHIIGYEVQEVISSVDWFKQSNNLKIDVAGYCEGGLIAFYATAVDKRIDAALVSEYFTSRQDVWDELPKVTETAKKYHLSTGMMVTSINGANSPNVEKVLQTVSQLGIMHYRMGPLEYDFKQGIWESLVRHKKNLLPLVELNEKYGIQGSYQNHTGVRIGSPRWNLWELIRDYPAEFISTQFDVCHAVTEGAVSWILSMRLLSNYIGSLAIKNFTWQVENGKAKTVDVSLGQGIVDFKKYLTILKELNIVAPITLHVEYPFLNKDEENFSLLEKQKIIVGKLKYDVDFIRGNLN